ncbi:hypothetical protein LX36DRAFT_230193 [Colletotrichum falcatum]|nr:hypothetical protein LX36DRAFT_230193 [Colletotrichum falcatum]
MDQDQSRSFDETAGQDAVGGDFSNHTLQAPETESPYPWELEFSSDSVVNPPPGSQFQYLPQYPYLPQHLPQHLPQYPYLLPQYLPQQDPCQAWKQVNSVLPITAQRSSDPWNPVAVGTVRTDHLAPQLGHATLDSTPTHSQSSCPPSVFDQPRNYEYLDPFTTAPPTPRTPSVRSVRSGRSVRTTCPECGESVNVRLMERHNEDRHPQETDLKYTCKCGHTDPAKRKSNHTRHLEKCKWKDDPDQFFTCRCGYQQNDCQAHLDHIRDCGRRRPGRPPNSARTVS